MNKTLALLALFLFGSTASWLSAQNTNIAIGKPVSSSAPTWGGQVPENITDGVLNNQSHPEASSGTIGFTYEIDLGSEFNLDRIEVVNRSGCCPQRLSNYRVKIFADGGGSPGIENWSADIRTDGSNSGDGGRDILIANLDPGRPFGGRYLHVINLSNEAYNPQIAEIEVFEAPIPLISFFNTDAGNITQSGNPSLPTTATLSWSVLGADAVTISELGGVAVTGSQSVGPASTTTYLLTATNPAGSSFAEVTVGVDEAILPPVLNEFMADNGSTLEDQEGDSPDWLEIYNRNAFNLTLEDYYLTDDSAALTTWRFPAGASVPANGYLIVFLSGKDLRDPTAPLHTDFQLSKSGEYLALVAPDGTTVLGQFPTDFPTTMEYPAQKEDRSYGLGAGQSSGYFDPPTPGVANGASFNGFVEDTEFDLNRGFYRGPIDVAIATNTPGATIRYTTDGSLPSDTHGTLYSDPVHITTTTTLRALAYHTGLAPTDVDTHTYIYPDAVLQSPEMNQTPTRELRDSLSAIPSMSIVTPNSINGSSEVPTSFEMIFPDGSDGFQVDCGVKQFGGAFTNFAKKNFRMYFRSQYGPSKLRFPVFDGFDRGITAVSKFDQLNLRSGSHDMNQRGFYMSNRFTDDTMLDMGNINPHGRFVHLYLNGAYWGQYHLRERWNASMLSEYLGGPKDSYEAINGNWNVGGWADSVVSSYDGDGSAWERIKGLADDYDAIQPYHDVVHYIDYMLMFMFGDSEDEYRCVGPAGPGSGFKWFLNDADGYLRNAGNRTGFSNQSVGLPGGFGRSSGDGPGSIFSLLYKEGDPDYRMLLADRIHKHFFNDGAMTPGRTIARLTERATEVDDSFKTEAIRWGYRTHASWTSAKNNALNSILPGRTASAIANFKGAGFYPSVDAPTLNQHGGGVPSDFIMHFSAPAGDIYYTIDGSDPRLPGGALSPDALLYSAAGVSSVTEITKGAMWKYLDDGSPLQTSWRQVEYDDATWVTGPAELGYGDNDEAREVSYGGNPNQRYVTTYFRKSFDLVDVGDIVSAEIQLKRDDGAIVYLNGEEIDRHNLTGVVDSQTLASRASDDGNLFHAKSIDASKLQNGTNVIAVEIHQESPSSSDISFDFELSVERITGESALRLKGNTLAKSRARAGGQWSALDEAFFQINGSLPVAPGELAVSELHYNPAGTENNEFIELMNVSDQAINLRGVTLTDGVTFSFPDNRDTILVPGERLLVVDSQFAIDNTYGLGLPIGGIYQDNLANNGEQITIETSSGTTLLDFTYDDVAPWPVGADNAGYSLTLSVPGADPTDPSNWRASSVLNGTPGIGDGTSFVGDPDLDLDRDGFIAFAEHALGTSDLVFGDARDAIALDIDSDGRLTIEFPRNAAADDALTTVEISPDLLNWTGGAAVTEFVSVLGNIVTYRTLTGIDTQRALFMRLRFERR